MVSGAMGNIYEDLFRISSEDVCIGISFPRYSNRTIDALDFARGKDATIIAITDSVSSPIAEKAEHALIARSDMAGFDFPAAQPFAHGFRLRHSPRVQGNIRSALHAAFAVPFRLPMAYQYYSHSLPLSLVT